ncbi:MAG: TIGR04551 family protein [Kofleriaceae bacterium]|nr:TIGR04551 family protein [Kofleriaceae bacterium]
MNFALSIAGAMSIAAALYGSDALAEKAGFAEAVDDGNLASASPSESSSVEISGYFRTRGEVLYNFDLDRGLLASGQPLFPVPAGDPSAQALRSANMRLRTDLRLRAPGSGLSVVVRTDLLDNLTLGSTPNLRGGTPAASPGQEAPVQGFRIKRAYGEALLPIGVLSVGRQGSHWGLGMVANGGDCEGCDGGDAADRISFVTPLVGHIFALAYDISATGPLQVDHSGSRSIDIEPTDDVQSLTFAFMRYHSEVARKRRGRAGRVTVEYGAYLSHRWQDKDIPSSYLGDEIRIGPNSIVHRGFSATATDAWFRLSTANLRIEAEAAYLRANVDQGSLVPGVEFYDALTSNQFGAALESELTFSRLTVGLDAGSASGDPSPGFGAQPDDLQAAPPFDTHIDNFRFHTDYRVDKILFREIIGTVTDAMYLRPHLRFPLADASGAKLVFDAAAIASWAIEATSTPSGQKALGIEFDPTLRYETRDGFVAALEYAILLPLGGFDNPVSGLDARSAQLWRLHLRFPF